MLHKAINTITEADLQRLVDEGRREDVQLEFKQTLPGNSDDGKKEFLKDVTAMANSSGGDIIYGIREDRSNPDDEGKAVELVGLGASGIGADAAKLWMTELLNSSVEERVLGIAIRDVPLSAGGYALIVRVPKSWNSPHVVRHKNHWRFYARNSAGVRAREYFSNLGEIGKNTFDTGNMLFLSKEQVIRVLTRRAVLVQSPSYQSKSFSADRRTVNRH